MIIKQKLLICPKITLMDLRIWRYLTLLLLSIYQNATTQDPSITSFSSLSVSTLTEQSGKPLGGASVVLLGTTFGSVTDISGVCQLQNIPPGNYTLVASKSGFDPKVLKITVRVNVSHHFIVRLNERPAAVKATQSAHPRAAEIARVLLGNSSNSMRCKVTNLEGFHVTETSTGMIVSSNEPVIIENRGLGYRLSLDLDTLIKSPRGTTWSGKVSFTTLSASAESEQEDWNQKRQIVYQGSLRHFLRSAANNTLSEEGFDVYLASAANAYWRLNQGTTRPARREDYLEEIRGTKTFKLNHKGWALEVRYERETVGSEPQVSWIVLTGQKAEFTDRGVLVNPRSVRILGRWVEEGLADRLPLDYEPK